MSKHTTRAEHPLVTVITHWIHVVALSVLIWTGFWIHRPWYQASFSTIRTWHLMAAFILVATGAARFYWAFFGRGSADLGETKRKRDFLHFMPERQNRHKTWQMIKYYLFLRKTHPCTAKYNPLQKVAYQGLGVAILIHMSTGLALWGPTSSWFSTATYWLGGPVTIRLIHYLAMWAFIVITVVHIYLTLVEAAWEIPLMFWWKERLPIKGVCVEDQYVPRAQRKQTTKTGGQS